MVDPTQAVPGGERAQPDELSSDELTRFLSDFTSSNAFIERLQAAYEDLKTRYSALHDELASANRQLQGALEAHASAAAYFENILASVSSGVISVDLEGRIRHFNKAAERIFGLDAQQVLGRRYGDVLPVDPPCAERALRGARAVNDGEKIYTDPEGQRRPLAVSTSLLTDHTGQVLGAVEIINDLSRLRTLEMEMGRVRELAVVGEMAATVAHEIRNPLGGIAGFAGLLAREFDERDARRALADKIVRGCDNLNRIVTNLLQYAQPVKLERRECDLAGELREELTLFEEGLRRQGRAVRLRRQFPVEPLHLSVDPVHIRMAVHNLLVNAADAVGQGEILCGLECERHKGEGRRLRIWVADNGPGIPDAHRDKVFTPFFTTKDKGTGLGLAMVRKVMDAHRGSVSLCPSPLGGACVELRLAMSMT